MKRIIINENLEPKDSRETCFGIVTKGNKLLVVWDDKHNQYSLVGGGIETEESHQDTLEREFMEEIGATIKNIKELVTIDCHWLAGGDYPFESIANIYTLNIDEFVSEDHEYRYEYIDINKVDLPLPYQKEAIKYYLENK